MAYTYEDFFGIEDPQAGNVPPGMISGTTMGTQGENVPATPDQYKVAALLATLPDSDSALTRMLIEQQRADALYGSGPEGQMVGNVYVPPQITEYGSQLYDAYRGRQREDAALARYDDSNLKRDEAVQQMIDALRKGDPASSTIEEPDPTKLTLV